MMKSTIEQFSCRWMSKRTGSTPFFPKKSGTPRIFVRHSNRKTALAVLILTVGSVASAQTISHQTINPNVVTRVATALNHISLIEFPEPITRTAVGSDDIHIEWHGNTLALKPVKQGQSTNLFVWTAHTQTSYEILPPGDVTHASFVIDQTMATPAHPRTTQAEVKISEPEMQKAADTLIAQAMLQGSPVNSRDVKNSGDHVNVRITEVVRDKDALYVRYTVSNPSQHPYRLSTPSVFEIAPKPGSFVLGALKGMQIPANKVSKYGSGSSTNLTVREARVSSRDVNPGQTVDGVLCFKTSLDKPQLYRFVFANDDSHPVSAAAVL